MNEFSFVFARPDVGLDMEKEVAKFRSFEEAEKADRDFYDKLTPQARLEILLELLNHGPEQRLERTYRVTKFARR